MIWFIVAVVVAFVAVFYGNRSRYHTAPDVFAGFLFTGLVLAFLLNLFLGIFLPNKTVEYTHDIKSLSVENVDGIRSFVYRDSKGLHTDSIDSDVVKGSPRLSMTETDFVVFNGWLSVMNFNPNATTFNVPKGYNITITE